MSARPFPCGGWSDPDCVTCTGRGGCGPSCPPGRYPCTAGCFYGYCQRQEGRHWCSAHRIVNRSTLAAGCRR